MDLRIPLMAGATTLALMLPAAAQQTSPVAPGMAASAAVHLNMRAGPGTEHDRITVIPEGATLRVEECVPSWCQVDYSGRTGYVWQAYLEPAQGGAVADAEAGSMPGDEWILQATRDFDLRAGPGADHDTISVVPEGATMAVNECVPGWCEVDYDGTTGFIEIIAATPEETTAALAPPAADAGIARTTGDLNLRSGAGLEHSPMAVIPAGATVEIRSCMPDRVWCEVTYGGMTGYASERYLDFAS